MNITISNKTSSDSEDMDVGEEEGKAVPIRSIATHSAPHSPAISAGDAIEMPPAPQHVKFVRAKTYKILRSPIPVLNKDTENSETYDAELLISPKTQERVWSEHRMKKSRSPRPTKLTYCKSLDVSMEKERISIPRYSKNYFDNRSEELKKGIEKKFGKFAEEISKKELEECSFIPNIEKLKGKPPTSPKNLTERLLAKENKLKGSQEVDKNLTFTPKLCKKSKKMAKQSSDDEPRHESLYKHYKSRSNKDLARAKVDNEREAQEIVQTQITVLQPEPQEPFIPSLNVRSKNMLRTVQFGENYNPPQARRNSHTHSYIQNLCISPKSEKVLIEKFSKEFNDAVGEEALEISYAHLIEILRSMYFVLGTEKNTEAEKEAVLKLWAQLSSEVCINRDQLLMFLMAIMRYKPHMFYKNKPNLIAQEESDRIHNKYLILYENRLSVINKSNVNQSFKHTYDFSFKPEINENSKALVELSNDKSIKVEERLNDRLNLNLTKKEKLKEKYIKIKENECTFQPKIISKFSKAKIDAKETNKETMAKEYLVIANGNADRNEALYSLAFIAKNKSLKSFDDKERLEKELIACTFSPKVISKPKEAPPPTIFGSDKAVQRLAKAREEKLLQKLASEKGFPFQGEKNMPKVVIEQNFKPPKSVDSITEITEKPQKLRDWENRKLKELKAQKEKERIKLEILEKQKNDAEMQVLQEKEEKRKKTIDKIKQSEEKRMKNKKKEGKVIKPFFFHEIKS